ncbi:MAG: T9SS type A sorting domain-containing protein [Muribaculaceae bacterium]|nr:T9SS type A sorting domain-containing protein [Muribaculaceae bacterium]
MHPTDVDGSSASRAVEVLAQNDPNPFSSDTRISYFLPEGAQSAIICIYDLLGKQVEQLAVTGPGAGSVTLRGGNLQAGMYIYSLIANGKELASKKMILTK